MNTFTEEQKKMICAIIKKIKDKNIILKIFKVIYDRNQSFFLNKKNEHVITEINGLVYIYFHNLSNETYWELENITKNLNFNDIIEDSDNEILKLNLDIDIQDMKYTNKDISILKRKYYEDNFKTDRDNYQSFDINTLTDSN